MTAVQDVNVIRDAWDWAALAAGVVGSVAALIAIWFAVQAQRDATAARREVAVERRRQFEVEVLRGLLDDVDAGGLVRQPHFVIYVPSSAIRRRL